MLGVEELYHRYRDDVFRYLCSLTHDPVLAEDLLSETFLCAIQKAGSFRGEGSERTWLFGIARNLWLQALRRHRPTVELSDLLGLYVEDTVGSALDSLIIMPVVGALGYLFLRRRWYFTPLGVALLGFVWHALVMDVAGPVWHILITGPLMYAAIYTALCLMGMLAAKLFVYAFGKEAPDVLHR